MGKRTSPSRSKEQMGLEIPQPLENGEGKEIEKARKKEDERLAICPPQAGG